jgi:hypothetical protein
MRLNAAIFNLRADSGKTTVPLDQGRSTSASTFIDHFTSRSCRRR